MPPISGMPPPPPEFLSSGASEIAASVVTSRPATDAASCSAVRTTLVGIDHAGLDEVFVNVRRRVEAHILVAAVEQLARYDRAVMAGILDDLTQWRIESLAHDIDTASLVVILTGQALR